MTWAVRDLFHREGDRLLSVVAEVVRAELKQGDGLAADLGVPASNVSAALHGSGRYFSVTWLPAVLHADRERRILRHLAALVDCEVVPKKRLTPEERLDLIEKECRAAGAAGEAIMKRAYGEDNGR